MTMSWESLYSWLINFPLHSTETTLLCVKNDILRSIDDKKAVVLILLDLSDAFDNMDHNPLRGVEQVFRATGSAAIEVLNL